MPVAIKTGLKLIEKGQQWRKKLDFDNYIKQLISVYTSPFLHSRYDYAELMSIQKQAAAGELDNRFQSDRIIMVRLILAAFLPDAEVSIQTSSDKDIAQALNILSEYQTNAGGQDTDWQRSLISALGCLCEHNRQDGTSKLLEKISTVLTNAVTVVPTSTSKRHDANYIAPSKRARLVAAILDQLIEDGRVPRFFELDHLDDIVPIIESRYAGPIEKHHMRAMAVIRALSALSTDNPDLPVNLLSKELHAVLGDNHPYVPKHGQLHPTVRNIIPDLFDEFTALRANDNPGRFLEINKEYSFRQRTAAGAKSNPWGLALLGGFEQNHHLMLRTLLSLIEKNAISQTDEALIVGPRYPDELAFFRKHLLLPKTIGIDLFDDEENGIVAADMHNTGFAPDRFRLIYCAGTLNYAYNLRRVVEEFTRILKRPGYLILTDNANRVNGVDPLGRSDPMNAEVLIGLFHQHKINVLAQDNGKTPFPAMFHCWPCVTLEILD